MEYVVIAIVILIAYFLGSIPTGYLLVKWIKKQDIRTLGSGNIGATNVFRNFGWKLGLATLIIDILKGLAAIRSVDIILPLFSDDILIGHYILAGSCAILGHFMPIWLNWKGGKAVATSLGVILGLLPFWFSLIVVGVFVVTYVISRRKVSLGSMAAAVTAILAKMFFGGGFNYENYESSIFIIAIVVLIIFTHRENIKRLLSGTEPKT